MFECEWGLDAPAHPSATTLWPRVTCYLTVESSFLIPHRVFLSIIPFIVSQDVTEFPCNSQESTHRKERAIPFANFVKSLANRFLDLISFSATRNVCTSRAQSWLNCWGAYLLYPSLSQSEPAESHPFLRRKSLQDRWMDRWTAGQYEMNDYLFSCW